MERLKAYLRPYIRPYQRSFRQGMRSARRVMLKPLRKIGCRDTSQCPPLRSIEDPETWAVVEGGQYTPLFAAETATRRIPKSPEKAVHWKIKREYSRPLPSVFKLEIPDGRIWAHYDSMSYTDSIAVISGQNSLIGGVSYEFSKAQNLGEHAIFSEYKLSPAKFLPGKTLVLANVKGEMFYHWMMEVLPKLRHYSDAEIHAFDHIVVNDFSYRFARDSFELLGLDASKVISLREHPHIKAEYMSVPSPSGKSGNPPAWVIAGLRDAFLPIIPASTAPSRKIYISRADAQVRQVSNENELLPLLEAAGFEPVQLQKMSLIEQISCFAEATHIAAPHGAGLSHLTFASPGTRVLEFFDPLYVNACFYALADICGHDYTYIIGQGKRPPEGVDLEISIAHISVEPEQMRQGLKLMQDEAVPETYKDVIQ